MATFTGTTEADIANAATGTLTGFTGGTIAELQDTVGDLFNGQGSADTIIAGAGNDTINGGGGFDELVGGGGGDQLNGGDGDDNLFGQGGADGYNGGNGFDIVYHRSNSETTGVFVNLTSAAVTIGTITRAAFSGNDAFGNTESYIAVEGVEGTFLSDTLVGGGEDNWFRGSGGNDTIQGGGGFDEMTFQPLFPFPGQTTVGGVPNSGIVVTFSGGGNGTVNNDGFGGTDVFTSIERIRATQFIDVVNGDEADNSFRGLAGNDTFNGGGGIDQVDYQSDAAAGFANGTGAVRVDLAAGTATDGFGDTDTFTSVESARGTAGNDTMTGSFRDETLIGNAGDDRLIGFAGRDFLRGDAGNDLLIGDGGLSLTAAAQWVRRLYIATLDRGPDDGGWAGWAAAREGGQTQEQIAQGFVGSSEFQTKYGALGNAAFVTLLYQNVLDRNPDAAGLAAFTQALDSGQLTRTAMVVQFSESAEFKTGTSPELHAGQIFRLYGATLARAPDAGGFEGWTDQMGGGRGLVDIAAGFVGSSEFQTRYGALDNTGFVTLLYQNVLGRAPDQAGLDGWLALMSGPNALSRTQVVTGFSESGEYVAGTRAGLDAFVRATMANWSDTLNGGAGDDKLTGGRGADRFVFTRSEGGNDIVYGFDGFDTLQLTGFGFANPAAALAAMSQQGNDVVLVSDSFKVTFEDVLISSFRDLPASSWLLS